MHSLAIEAGDWPAEALLEALIVKASTALQAAVPAEEAADLAVADVAFLFTDDAHQQKLNAIWRGMDKPTNVLSFPTAYMPLPEGEVLPLGDVSLAFETIKREAEEQEKSFEAHLSHLIIHGLLHLLGYDHEEDEEEAEAMEAIEISALQGLDIANPYADL